MGEKTYAIWLPNKEKKHESPIISRESRKEATYDSGCSGSPIAQTDRSATAGQAVTSRTSLWFSCVCSTIIRPIQVHPCAVRCAL